MQLLLKILSGIANSADPYQTAPPGAVRSGSTLFAYPILLETFTIVFNVYCKSSWKKNKKRRKMFQNFIWIFFLAFKYSSVSLSFERRKSLKNLFFFFFFFFFFLYLVLHPLNLLSQVAMLISWLCVLLTPGTLGKILADDILKYFSYFSQVICFIISCKLYQFVTYHRERNNQIKTYQTVYHC